MVLPADPLGIQGVSDPRGDSEDTAPVSADLGPEPEPSLVGEPAPTEKADREDDRPDKNYVKELQRKQAKLEDRLESMQIELAAQALASERSAARTEPEKPPYSDAEVKAFLDNGDMNSWAEAREANAEWRAERRIAQAQTQQTQVQTAQVLDRHIKKVVQLDEDSDFGQAVMKRAKELRDEYPGFAKEFYPLLAKAELAGSDGDLAEDLRSESLSRGAAATAGIPKPSGVPVEMKINYDAPNRGLSAEEIAKIHRAGLEEVLVKGATPQIEAKRRKSLERILARENELRRGRFRR